MLLRSWNRIRSLLVQFTRLRRDLEGLLLRLADSQLLLRQLQDILGRWLAGTMAPCSWALLRAAIWMSPLESFLVLAVLLPCCFEKQKNLTSSFFMSKLNPDPMYYKVTIGYPWRFATELEQEFEQPPGKDCWIPTRNSSCDGSISRPPHGWILFRKLQELQESYKSSDKASITHFQISVTCHRRDQHATEHYRQSFDILSKSGSCQPLHPALSEGNFGIGPSIYPQPWTTCNIRQ